MSHQCLARLCPSFTPGPCCCRFLWCLATSTNPGTFGLQIATRVSGFPHCTSSRRFVPFLLRKPRYRTVEFGPSTPERLRPLRCMRTSETRVPTLPSEFSLTLSGHSRVVCLSVGLYMSVCVCVSVCLCHCLHSRCLCVSFTVSIHAMANIFADRT